MAEATSSAAGGGDAEGARGRPTGRRSRGPLVAAAIILALSGGLYLSLRDRTPLLTRTILDAQRARWLECGIRDYDLVIAVENPAQSPARYRVEVRAGRVAAFELNGQAITPNDAYTVAGLFEWLDRELDLAGGSGEGAPSPLEGAILRAEFDDIHGFPRTFKRIAPRKSTFLRVESFTPIAPAR
jgi:hypothetical protein